MPARKGRSSAESDELTELREQVAELKDYVRVLIDGIDEIREELQYLNINRIQTREPPPPVPVLKRMAADPCAKDWNERLVIDRGDDTPTPGPAADREPDHIHALGSGKPPAGKLFADPGDQGELF